MSPIVPVFTTDTGCCKHVLKQLKFRASGKVNTCFIVQVVRVILFHKSLATRRKW